jgi:hypothetical protein
MKSTIRVIKHIIVEPAPDRHSRIKWIEAAIGATFLEALS